MEHAEYYATVCASLETRPGRGQSKILDFPNEVLDGITAYLQQSDLRNMSLARKGFIASANLALYTNPCLRSSIAGDLTRLCAFLSTIREYPDMAKKVKNISFKIQCPKGRALSTPNEYFYTKKRITGLSDEGILILNDLGQALGMPTFSEETDMMLQDLRDIFYALVLIACPNIRTLHMEVEPIRMERLDADENRHVSAEIVSTFMDRLLDMAQRPIQNPINCLQKLKTFEIRSVIHCTGIQLPRFVDDILQIQTLQKFTTDYFMPIQMPVTCITSLKIVETPYEGDFLEKTSFENCHQLTHLEVPVARMTSPSHVRPQTILYPVKSTLTSLKLKADASASIIFSLCGGDLSNLADVEELDICCGLLPYFRRMPIIKVKILSITGLEKETTIRGEVRIERWERIGLMLRMLKTAYDASELPCLKVIRLVAKKDALGCHGQRKFCEAQAKYANVDFVSVKLELEFE